MKNRMYFVTGHSRTPISNFLGVKIVTDNLELASGRDLLFWAISKNPEKIPKEKPQNPRDRDFRTSKKPGKILSAKSRIARKFF